MRVLVCGDRNWVERGALVTVLDQLWIEHRDDVGGFTVIHGAARGADRMAGEWAQSRRDEGVVELPFPADWRRYKRGAGPVRNTQMLVEGKPDLVVAFHDNLDESSGTADMVQQATDAGVTVRLYPLLLTLPGRPSLGEIAAVGKLVQSQGGSEGDSGAPMEGPAPHV